MSQKKKGKIRPILFTHKGVDETINYYYYIFTSASSRLLGRRINKVSIFLLIYRRLSLLNLEIRRNHNPEVIVTLSSNQLYLLETGELSILFVFTIAHEISK